jgi:hypothetical protein
MFSANLSLCFALSLEQLLAAGFAPPKAPHPPKQKPKHLSTKKAQRFIQAFRLETKDCNRMIIQTLGVVQKTIDKDRVETITSPPPITLNKCNDITEFFESTLFGDSKLYYTYHECNTALKIEFFQDDKLLQSCIMNRDCSILFSKTSQEIYFYDTSKIRQWIQTRNIVFYYIPN